MNASSANPSRSDDNHWHIAVLIPARNEEQLLPPCLASVAAARALLPTEVTSEIVVVSDGSTDRTVELAKNMLKTTGVVVSIAAANVGAARASAAGIALRRNRVPLICCWLANTDADCVVPVSWLLDHLHIAMLGHAAVTGIVEVHDFSEHLPMVKDRFRQSYRINADGTHPHVHGANFGVRADAYLAAGGWNEIPTAEDHDLWRRLRATGGSHLSDASLRVITSGRRFGRAPLGFARSLALHNS